MLKSADLHDQTAAGKGQPSQPHPSSARDT